jgi:predicted O-linked N-acetylglucosamine transferase (SPINDLY family)
MDFLIADPATLPSDQEMYFTERIWRLPQTRLCFTPPVSDLEVAPLPALANGFVTFGCFNNLSKVNDQVLSLWARILTACPDSRLFLKAKQLSDGSARDAILKRFVATGISPDRLILEGLESRGKYLSAFSRVDFAFDPFPYTGGTVTVEGLWMGVPVITLSGQSFLSRQGVGILTNLGLTDWIASDLDDYVSLALNHAKDLDQLAQLRKGLRALVLRSPLFDASRFAEHFNTALHAMWSVHCDNADVLQQ